MPFSGHPEYVVVLEAAIKDLFLSALTFGLKATGAETKESLDRFHLLQSYALDIGVQF